MWISDCTLLPLFRPNSVTSETGTGTHSGKRDFAEDHLRSRFCQTSGLS